MNENHNFLAFDCGATSGRAILGTFSDGAFSMKEVWRFPNKPLCRDGRMYWDFDALREQVLECLRSLGGRGVKLESIGVDTWGVDFGCISEDGSLCARPRCYRDPYTSGIPEKVLTASRKRVITTSATTKKRTSPCSQTASARSLSC